MDWVQAITASSDKSAISSEDLLKEKEDSRIKGQAILIKVRNFYELFYSNFNLILLKFSKKRVMLFNNVDDESMIYGDGNAFELMNSSNRGAGQLQRIN